MNAAALRIERSEPIARLSVDLLFITWHDIECWRDACTSLPRLVAPARSNSRGSTKVTVSPIQLDESRIRTIHRGQCYLESDVSIRVETRRELVRADLETLRGVSRANGGFPSSLKVPISRNFNA